MYLILLGEPCTALTTYNPPNVRWDVLNNTMSQYYLRFYHILWLNWVKLSHMPIPRSSFQIHLFHQYSSRTFPNHIGLSLVNSESLAHWIKDDDIPSGGQIIEVGRRICKRVWSGGERVTGWYVCFYVHLLFEFIWIINPVWTHSTASYFDRYLLEWQSPQRLPSWWTCWLLIVLTGYGIWSLNLFIYSFSMPLNSSWSCWANRCSYHCCKQVCVYLKPLTGQWSVRTQYLYVNLSMCMGINML